jgi:hypothetical protein
MNKKKEIDKLARLTILSNFISSKLKEQKDLVKSFVEEEDKVLKGIDHKLNVIVREYERFDSESFRKDQPEVYKSYKTKLLGRLNLSLSLTQKKRARSSQRISHFFKCKLNNIISSAWAFAHVPFSILHFKLVILRVSMI